jgi:hypothetical protein
VEEDQGSGDFLRGVPQKILPFLRQELNEPSLQAAVVYDWIARGKLTAGRLGKDIIMSKSVVRRELRRAAGLNEALPHEIHDDNAK